MLSGRMLGSPVPSAPKACLAVGLALALAVATFPCAAWGQNRERSGGDGATKVAQSGAVRSASSHGATATGGSNPSQKDVAEAQQHFQRARELYSQGNYREAAAELELARALDPTAKDLVWNLGVVHERLGMIDEALHYFRKYVEMDLEPHERARAESTIKRLEGARTQVKAPPEPPPTQEAPRSVAGERTDAPKEHGRVDAATVTAASIAVAGLGLGTFFALSALSSQPAAGQTTGPALKYADLESQAASAHQKAIFADVAFGVGAVSAILAAYLYFGRTKEPSDAGTRREASITPRVSFGTQAATIGLGGRF
jgi:tetratricopeptide (TPR) repeat protein